jgi:uncharacterized membrane protein YfcA
MTILFGFSLVAIGLIVGTLAGILGLGGGVFLVPILVALGFSPLNSVATSSVPVFISASSAIIAHLRSGQLKLPRAIRIGIVAAIAAQGGVQLAHFVNGRVLLGLFSLFLLTNIVLMRLRKKAQNASSPQNQSQALRAWHWGEIVTGFLGGVFSGFFGVGGGVIMVPLLVLLQGEPLKSAVRTSMAVVLVSSISSVAGHSLSGSVLWNAGLLLAAGSLVGAQIGVALLPKFPESMVRKLFVLMLAILAAYTLSKAIF